MPIWIRTLDRGQVQGRPPGPGGWEEVGSVVLEPSGLRTPHPPDCGMDPVGRGLQGPAFSSCLIISWGFRSGLAERRAIGTFSGNARHCGIAEQREPICHEGQVHPGRPGRSRAQHWLAASRPVYWIQINCPPVLFHAADSCMLLKIQAHDSPPLKREKRGNSAWPFCSLEPGLGASRGRGPESGHGAHSQLQQRQRERETPGRDRGLRAAGHMLRARHHSWPGTFCAISLSPSSAPLFRALPCERSGSQCLFVSLHSARPTTVPLRPALGTPHARTAGCCRTSLVPPGESRLPGASAASQLCLP
ncbi:uncharacterized protein LOC115282663 [Suricata suricatta]|uniref:uncharacterized protein LOC115282663 n=1 Tax=Suricata suricatta TaxID=37032 RepID=UPI0011556D2E|nr:uncharacterized protein LOC115282663 [Suricata suricatta]